MLLNWILKLVPKKIINKLVISPYSKGLVRFYDLLPKAEGPVVYKIANNASIEIDLAKPGERIISFNAFEPLVTKRILKIIDKDDIVLDIGAWIGYYTLIAASKVGSGGRVVSIEPHCENFKRLVRNLDLNRFENVVPLNLAVGREKSSMILVNGSDSLNHKIVAHGTGYEINTDSLDNIIEELRLESISLAIMDIEGFEHSALLGASNALRKGIIKNIICEIHPDKLKLNGTSDTELLQHIQSFGYKVNRFTNMVNVYHVHITR